MRRSWNALREGDASFGMHGEGGSTGPVHDNGNTMRREDESERHKDLDRVWEALWESRSTAALNQNRSGGSR